MAYILQFDEISVRPYLRNLALSREGRVILYGTLHADLSCHGDAYRNDPQRRLAPGSPNFRVDLLFRDPITRIIHNLHLIVSDKTAQYGILRIVYVEGFQGP